MGETCMTVHEQAIACNATVDRCLLYTFISMHILEHDCAKYRPISFSRSYFSQSPCFRAFYTTIVFQTYMPPINFLVRECFYLLVDIVWWNTREIPHSLRCVASQL